MSDPKESGRRRDKVAEKILPRLYISASPNEMALADLFWLYRNGIAMIGDWDADSPLRDSPSLTRVGAKVYIVMSQEPGSGVLSE